MKLKEFFKSIDHRFRDAAPLEGTVVSATLINWSNDPVGTVVYDTESQDVLKITVPVGDTTHDWDGSGSSSEIMGLLIGQIESTTQHLDRLELDRVVEQFTAAPVPSVQQSPTPTTGKPTGYTVNITATFTAVVDSATMDAALAEAKGRLKFPDHVQYKINKESVEKYY
jgi:hypothetical protein